MAEFNINWKWLGMVGLLLLVTFIITWLLGGSIDLALDTLKWTIIAVVIGFVMVTIYKNMVK